MVTPIPRYFASMVCGMLGWVCFAGDVRPVRWSWDAAHPVQGVRSDRGTWEVRMRRSWAQMVILTLAMAGAAGCGGGGEPDGSPSPTTVETEPSSPAPTTPEATAPETTGPTSTPEVSPGLSPTEGPTSTPLPSPTEAESPVATATPEPPCYELSDGSCVEETFQNPPVLEPDGDDGPIADQSHCAVIDNPSGSRVL